MCSLVENSSPPPPLDALRPSYAPAPDSNSPSPLRAAPFALLAAAAVNSTVFGAQAIEDLNSNVVDNSQLAPAVAEVAVAQHSQTTDAVQHFFTGGIGGCVGAAAVFPIDLAKTRLQAQKEGKNKDGSSTGRYTSGLHCLVSVLREEGVSGLYSGLSAQLIGVWPEKAVKLSANDFMRAALTNPATCHLSIPAAVAAGAFGGMCQVVFTNPLEIVKIQLQLEGVNGGAVHGGTQSRATAGELHFPAEASVHSSYEDGTGSLALAPANLSIIGSYEDVFIDQSTALPDQNHLAQVVQNVGFSGLYRGATVCACRDMVFSGIYFPLFSTLKDVFTAHAHAGPLWLLLAGTLAGAPAAYFSTPMDMVKTRVQDLTTSGGEQEANPLECLKGILKQEGWRALFTGGWARMARSAPQFGVTLLVYDSLNSWLIGVL